MNKIVSFLLSISAISLIGCGGGGGGGGSSPAVAEPTTPVVPVTYSDYISAADGFSCYVNPQRDVKCWGGTSASMVGALGQENTTELATSGNPGNIYDILNINIPKVKKFKSAGRTNCFINTSDQIFCFGRGGSMGDQGILGNEGADFNVGASAGDISGLQAINVGTGRTVKDFSMSADHICAVLDNDSLKCWGSNTRGQLGIGSSATNVGLNSGDMGDNLAAVNLGTGRTVKKVAVTTGASCAVLDNDVLKCWGQIDPANTSDPVGNVPSEMGDNLQAYNIGTGRSVKEIYGSPDGDFFCSIMDNDDTRCWGSNWSGQLAVGDTDDRGGIPSNSGDNIPVVNFGTGLYAKKLALRELGGCAILNDDSLKCWGNGGNGQNGLGSDTSSKGGNPAGLGDNLLRVNLGTDPATSNPFTVKEIYAGRQHACAKLSNDKIKCWGQSEALGHSSSVSYGDDDANVGDANPFLALTAP